jgi:hypothetical protein
VKNKIDEEDYDRIRDRQAERGTRKVKSIPRSGYKSDPDSTRKAYAAAMKNIKKVLNKETTDKWYKNQPEWGTDESDKKAKAMTPGQKKFKDLRNESLRSKLYKAAKFLGDVQAVKKNKVGKRIARRTAGKVAGKALGKLFK